MPAPRLEIAFRVGVTGASELNPAAVPRLRAQVAAILERLRAEVIAAAADPALTHLRCTTPAVLRVISPLADGADRLVAQEALRLVDEAPHPLCAVRLEVLLPFAPAEYEPTFANADPDAHAASIAAFRALLARAGRHAFALDGAATPDLVRHRSYEALGRTLVRSVDLMIAIWDRGARKGRGGTSDTVDFALRSDVPVVWLAADGEHPPVWLKALSEVGLDHPPVAAAQLEAHVRETLLPPPPEDGEEDASLPLLASLRRRLRADLDPLTAYFAESGRLNPNIARMHDAALRWIRRRGAQSAGTPASRSPSEPYSWLLKPFTRQKSQRPPSSFAALLAEKYQQRYRTSYLMILSAAALALGIAIASLVNKPTPVWLTAAELCVLLFIGGLWLANEVMRWHGRYVSYRVLAELLRTLPFLVEAVRAEPGTRADAVRREREPWEAWVYAMTVRSQPLPSGAATPERKQALKEALLGKLVGSQIAYHRQRRAECHGADALLGRVAATMFAATVGVVLLKLVLHLFHVDRGLLGWLGLLAALLPAGSAAVFGIRSYEDFGVLADQSGVMIEELEVIRAGIERLDPASPLVLQEMGMEALAASRLLVEDVQGWMNLVKLKAVEG